LSRRIVRSCGCKCHAATCHYPYTLFAGETLTVRALLPSRIPAIVSIEN
jgi:hypothetical protein